MVNIKLSEVFTNYQLLHHLKFKNIVEHIRHLVLDSAKQNLKDNKDCSIQLIVAENIQTTLELFDD